MSDLVTASTMPVSSAMTEEQFARHAETLASDAQNRALLRELLREDHFVYDERSTLDVVRMRGWVLVCLARIGISDDELVYALEELESGLDAYLVAAAACALRTAPQPRAQFAPFVMRAILNVRYQDQRISLCEYGGFAAGGTSTSAVQELLAVLKWLGPHAADIVVQVDSLRHQPHGLPRRFHPEVKNVLKAIRHKKTEGVDVDQCCQLPFLSRSIFPKITRRHPGNTSIETIVFEDHQGTTHRFRDVFRDRPSIVVFFYTRCDNPLKCSLTISKLARVQQRLRERGLADQVQTVAITYDPDFDLPSRLNVYALNRGVQLDSNHRMLRTTSGFDALRSYFGLGVNFIDAFVNRHRIELYIVDPQRRIAGSFERLQWNVEQVVDQVISVLHEVPETPTDGQPPTTARRPIPGRSGLLILATIFSFGVAFFPKCPLCWAAYLSLFGIAGLEQISYTPALQPILAALLVFNLGCLWYRARMTRRIAGFLLAVSGAMVLIVFRTGLGWESASLWGIAMTVAGALWCSLPMRRDADQSDTR